jgi:hypothetical protein
LVEADSRLSCLPLPLFDYLLGFFSESTDDADVTAVNYDFLLRRSEIPFCPFPDLNLLNKDIQKLTV